MRKLPCEEVTKQRGPPYTESRDYEKLALGELYACVQLDEELSEDTKVG
jgi:hypothetical protein